MKIIYPSTETGGICLVTSTGILPIEQVARKDVPAGVPYLIVNDADVPEDHTFFNAFEADFSNPHGYGIGSAAWFIEQYQAELATLDHTKNSKRVAELNDMIAIQQGEMGS